MSLPKVSDYKDLNTDMKIVPLSLEGLNGYMEQFDVTFDQKVLDLYEEKFLLYLRMCWTSNLCFIRSACKAEMKKKINYIVDVSFRENGHVHEAQCECGAGEGPYGHCKHVRTTLYACYKFMNGGEIKVEASCTDKLQQFHKSKKHTGSPVKANKLSIAGADELCEIDTFDPRPEEFRNNSSYVDYFYNICMNFKGISRTPIFQLFEPANMRAFASDHDYLEMSHEELFLKAIKILSVSEEEREKIEEYTRGQRTNERWFEERGKRIHSSNFYRVCSATDRTDLAKLAESLVTGRGVKQNEAIKHGNKYEKDAVDCYEKEFNVKVKRCGIFVSTALPFLGASPDGVLNEKTICEVKCPFNAKLKMISPQTVPYLRLEDGQLRLNRKHQYFYQVQGQLFCSDRKFCHFVVYTLTDMKCIQIERDDNFISSMIQKLTDFYEMYFKEAILKKLFYKD